MNGLDPARIAEALARLRDLHEPPPPGFWPPAPGWWIVLVVVLLAALAVLLWTINHRRSLKYRCLRLIEASAGMPSEQRFRALADLLRRAAVARFGRRAVARLHGQGWVAFLNGRLPHGQKLDPVLAERLVHVPYAEPGTAVAGDVADRLEKVARTFVRLAL